MLEGLLKHILRIRLSPETLAMALSFTLDAVADVALENHVVSNFF